MAQVPDKTKTVDGQQLSASDHAYVGDPNDTSTWKLPIKDKSHVQNALSRFNQTDLPAAQKPMVARKVAAKAKQMGIDCSSFEKDNCGTSDHADGNSGWIEIFRAGDYGGKGKFTTDDLDRVANAYDTNFHEAPVVVGHPADNSGAPAYGWIAGLKREGNLLLARETQMDSQFCDARSAGRYKKRSASFYTDSTGKPTYLRHVGWLGAQPPAVKGLRDIKFSDEGRQFTEVDFQEDDKVAAETKTIGEQVKEALASLFGANAGTLKTFSEDDAKRIATEAATAAAAPLQAEVTVLKTQLAQQTADFAELQKKNAGGEVEARAQVAIGKLKAKGVWIPAYEKLGVPLVFAELAKLTTTVEFGEGDAKKQERPLDLLVSFMETIPNPVPSGRHVGSVVSTAGDKQTGDKLTDAATALQKEKNISFSEALDQVAAEHPEWTKPGSAAGGAV